ncbi:MAG: NUDIX domain-containing protein [Burkholderiales bacterium]|nr:NUDIX domain-containing protein [Burkholderiales bacterium]
MQTSTAHGPNKEAAAAERESTPKRVSAEGSPVTAARRSAGLLLYRTRDGTLQVFLVHPGGPFWKRKDAGAWSIPKGELDADEAPLAAARREFAEETGVSVEGTFRALAPCRQKNGKTVHAFAVEADLDASAICSNTFTMEWPPRSGRMQAFPEVDRAGWFTLDEAAALINKGQRVLLDELRGLMTPPA